MPISALPYAAYQFAGGSGASSTGSGPALTVAGATTGIVGSGCTEAITSTTPGISITGSVSGGVWVNVADTAYDDKVMALNLATASRELEFYLYNVDSSVFTLNLNGTTLKTESVSPSFGWNHFGFSVSGGNAQLYMNGSAVGTAASWSPSSFASGAFTGVSNNGYGYTLAQFLYIEAAYSSGDFSYLYNGGSGVPYASMSNGGGAGASPAVRLNSGFTLGF